MDSLKLTAAFAEYLDQARSHEAAGRIDAAWACLEAAHIVGQRVTALHMRSHWEMLGLGWRTQHLRELLGQFARMLAAIIATRIWVPMGNRGRANVPAFAREPIPADLQEVMDRIAVI